MLNFRFKIRVGTFGLSFGPPSLLLAQCPRFHNFFYLPKFGPSTIQFCCCFPILLTCKLVIVSQSSHHSFHKQSFVGVFLSFHQQHLSFCPILSPAKSFIVSTSSHQPSLSLCPHPPTSQAFYRVPILPPAKHFIVSPSSHQPSLSLCPHHPTS